MIFESNYTLLTRLVFFAPARESCDPQPDELSSS